VLATVEGRDDVVECVVDFRREKTQSDDHRNGDDAQDHGVLSHGLTALVTKPVEKLDHVAS